MRAAAVLLLVLLAPAAAACSLVGPVPSPAAFTLVPIEGGEPRTVVIEGRMLGASCELSNPHLLADGTFAWMEVRYERHDARRDAHLLDLATGDERVVPLAPGSVDEFALWEGKLLYHARHFHAEMPATSAFHVHDVATGEIETLPFPPGRYVSSDVSGPYVVAVLREDPQGRHDRLYAYDVAASRWLLEGVPYAEHAGFPHASFALHGEWLVFRWGDVARLHHLPTGAARPLHVTLGDPGGTPLVVRAIEDGWAYGWEHFGGDGRRVVRYHVEEGTTEILTPPEGSLVGIAGGYYVLGRYSAPELHPLGELAWLDEHKLLLGGATAWLLGVVAIPTWWRWRRARG